MKNILYVTGSRADFGIIQNLLIRLDSNIHNTVDVVITGMQVEERFGNTATFVEQSGLNIIKRISMNLVDSSQKTSLQGLALLEAGLVDVFDNKKYDAVIILGDRYEMLAVASAATLYRVPIIHFHGGEQTLGNFDEAIRHAITKLSHLHLTSTESYRRRVIQMGEHPNTVFNVGSLGVENVLEESLSNVNTLSQKLGINLHKKKYNVILFHPETYLEDTEILHQVNELVAAIEEIKMDTVIIGSNVDSGSDIVMHELEKLVESTEYSMAYVKSLSSEDFHGLIQSAYVLIGNSSSGLIEVPSLNTPTINLGNRQKGRISGPSVINIPQISSKNIVKAVKELNTDIDFTNPYYRGSAINNSEKVILEFLNGSEQLIKTFYDI